MVRAAVRYGVLALLFACASFFQGGEIQHLIYTLANQHSTPDYPFQIATATRTIASGPLRGSQLIAVEGKPLASLDQFSAIVESSAPGRKIRITVVQPSRRALETFVEIPSVASKVKSGEIAVALCTKILIPAFAIGLGFAVTAIRPSDPNAWIMLAMLLGFAEVFEYRTWSGPVPGLVVVWLGFWTSLWPFSTAWFGLRFPERFASERRHGWLKFLLLIAAGGAGFFYFATVILWHRNINAAQVYRGAAVRAYSVWLASTIAGVTIFFCGLNAKIGAAKAADSKRRLRILLFGSYVAFLPALFVALHGLITGRDPFGSVPWPVSVAVLLMVAVFPVTLAYVIVVERAMDLRFVIRQSVKYAVAKGGLNLFRAAALAGCFYVIARAAAERQSAAALQLTVLQLTGIGAALVVVGRRRTAGLASQWIDRKFFREAYDSETVLTELAHEAGRFVEIGPLLKKVATRVGETLHVPDVVILLREGRDFQTAYSTRPGETLDIPGESGIVAALSIRREPLRVWFENAPEWIRELDGRDLQTLDYMRTQLLLPIPAKDGLTGIMSLGPKLSEGAYSDIDIRLMRSIAAQMGLALENSRLIESLAAEAAGRERLNREIEIAREVQQRLFPQTFPFGDAFECAGHCRPARAVGGDYFDFLELEGSRIGIAIGDVSGKGIAAALLMASLQASLRGQAAAGVRDLASLMQNVNRLVYESSSSNRYATFFYGEYDPAIRRLFYVNAGHNPPIVLRGGEALRLEATGPVVGLLRGISWQEQSCDLQPGDVFIGFTDGISEAMNQHEEEWEEGCLVEAARDLRCRSAADIVTGVFMAADAFTGDAPQFDDMTLVVMKIGSRQPASALTLKSDR